jgi:ParB family chromosome partitioning protein
MRKALGRGLDALLPGVPSSGSTRVRIDKIRPNRLQPRKHFDPVALSGLAASIKEHGLAQPLLVSLDPDSEGYELIAGERRLRAAQLAGLTEVDVVVRPVSNDQERLTIALIENLQRSDLNPIEEALGYLRLMKEAQLSQTQLTQIVGKSKSAVSNTLRLLDLPENMQKSLQYGQLTEGHARALLMVEDPIEKQRLFTLTTERKLSVRELEDLARQANGKDQAASATPSRRPRRERPGKTPEIASLEDALRQRFSTKVEIRTKRDPAVGSVVINFYSLSDFDRIMSVINK